MELKDNCKVLLTKNNMQKVKCFKFISETLNRELAVHENVDNKKFTSVTDVRTGLRMFGLEQSVDKVKMEDVMERLRVFLAHFTLEGTLNEFARLEEDLPCSK